MKLESLAILLVVAAAAAAYLFFRIRLGRQKDYGLRRIEAVDDLEESLGLALEEASQVHVSLGSNGIFEPNGLASLAAAGAVREISRHSAMMDNPPVVTTGDPLTALVAQSEMEDGYFQSQFPDQFDATAVQQAGTTPLAYTAAAMQTAAAEPVSANVLLGNYSAEAGLIAFHSAAQEAETIAAGNNLEAQAVFYASTDADIIGEELYALPGYLSHRPQQVAGVKAQDVLRWFALIMLIGGALLKFLKVL